MDARESADELPCEYAERDIEARYAANRLDPAEAEAFEAHYFACDACWARVQRAIELRHALETGEARQPAMSPGAPRRPALLWPLAAAAAFAAVLVGTWGVLLDDAARPDVTRGPETELVVSASAAPEGLTAGWAPVAEADVYRVRLYTADGTLVIERETPSPSVTIPRSELSQVDAASALYWSVEALDELRRPVVRSPLTEALPADGG